MSFLQKIHQCNNMRHDQFVPFYLQQARIGWIRHDFMDHLSDYPDVFVMQDDAVTLHADLDDMQARTQAIYAVVEDLHNKGVIGPIYNEIYPVTTTHMGDPEFLIDRSVASYFGTRTFGQHLNGYVVEAGEKKMWIARRAQDRNYEPGKLDQIVAGGFPYGVSAKENMRKECKEEAGMPPELADQAIATGAIGCRYETPKGVKPETLYCYDIELPLDFQPVCTDGEVDGFLLLPVAEIAEIVRNTDDFKLNCNLVVIDFLIRHGYLGAEDQDYDLLVSGLHQ